MAQGTERQSTVGFSLHLRATELINDFLKESEGHFQYLQEILAEAKEHFARRDSVHLLPKTPCTKTKRRRIVKDPQPSPTLASPPLQTLTAEIASTTPDNAKTLSCNLSPTENADTTLNESKRSTRSSRARASKQKRTSKPKRKQPRRGAKNVSDIQDSTEAKEDANVSDNSATTTNSKAVTPKRLTRSKRKQTDNGSDASDEATKKKNRNDFNEVQMLKSKPPSPRRSTRNKRKETEQEPVVPEQSAACQSNDVNQIFTPSPQLKKSKVIQPMIPKTPQNAEVFIPETPQMHQKQNAETPTGNRDVKTVRSSLKMVLSPPVVSSEVEEQEVCAYNVKEKDEALSSKVVVVEAVSYEESSAVESTSDEIKSNVGDLVVVTADTADKSKEEPISEAIVSSTKKLRRETRASVKGTKRKQGSKKDQGKKARISSPYSNESQIQEENLCTAQVDSQASSSSSDEGVVTSTTTSTSPKIKRKLRPSRASRRSSRQSVQNSRADRRSIRIRKSKSLVKSSVMLKLSAKKLMPTLGRSTHVEEDEFVKDNNIKTNLFQEFETDTQSSDAISEKSQENSIPNTEKNPEEYYQSNEVENKVDILSEETSCLDEKDAQPDEDDKGEHEKQAISESEICDKDDVDAAELNNTQSTCPEDVEEQHEEDEFHDTQETSQADDDEEEDHFHDATDTVDADVTFGPITRSSSRNHSSGSSGSNRCDSASSDDHSTCKQPDEEHNRSQSSPEPSQENCLLVENNDDDDAAFTENPFGFENKMLKNNAGVIHSFIKRNTPKKVDRQEKSRKMKLAILEKEEKEKERIQRLAQLKQKKIEDQKRRREEKERKVAELRAAKTREQKEKKEQLEKKAEMRKRLEDKARKIKEKEEEAKRKARQEKKAECDARRKQEEEQRKQKQREKDEEERKHREMMQRKAEFEEQERQRKILEAKRHQEFREQELQREKELEKQRMLKEKDEKERKAKEEKERQERKLKEDKEKEERERKRIAALFREKEEQERREREKKAKEEQLRKEREIKFRIQEEQEKEIQRLRKLQELREAEEAKMRALRKVMEDKTTYDMTPPPPPKVRCISTTENYNIDDICSDDSTDDEDAPKKKIPQWAQGAKLKAALLSQSDATIDEIEGIFGGVTMPNLDDIFTQKKRKRFYQRTSSAHWDTPPLKPLNRGTLI